MYLLTKFKKNCTFPIKKNTNLHIESTVSPFDDCNKGSLRNFGILKGLSQEIWGGYCYTSINCFFQWLWTTRLKFKIHNLPKSNTAFRWHSNVKLSGQCCMRNPNFFTVWYYCAGMSDWYYITLQLSAVLNRWRGGWSPLLSDMISTRRAYSAI